MRSFYNTIGFLILFCHGIFTQDSSYVLSEEHSLKLKALGIELTTSLSIIEFGGHIDLDLIKLSPERLTLGVRGSIEKYGRFFEVGGPTQPSPIDYFISLRITDSFRMLRFTIMSGISYHSIQDRWKTFPSGFLSRSGVELKFVIDGGFGIIFKVSSSFNEATTCGGVGFIFGLNN